MGGRRCPGGREVREQVRDDGEVVDGWTQGADEQASRGRWREGHRAESGDGRNVLPPTGAGSQGESQQVGNGHPRGCGHATLQLWNRYVYLIRACPLSCLEADHRMEGRLHCPHCVPSIMGSVAVEGANE